MESYSPTSTFGIRQGASADIPATVHLDHVARADERRRAFIARVIEAGECYLAMASEGLIAGYAALDYTFYDQGFVSMLYVREEHRRMGAGTLLMVHLEGLCATPKIFTSTNLSNIPMQRLLSKLAYNLCGVIDHLDEGDPELVYVKFLAPDKAAA